MDIPEKSVVLAIVGVSYSDSFALIAHIHNGLPFKSLERLEQHYKMTRKELLSVIGINAQTARRRQIKGKMSIQEGERIVRYARLLDAALGLMGGNKGSALRWLATPSRALGNQTPLAYAATSFGAQQVEHLIGKIEHGVVI